MKYAFPELRMMDIEAHVIDEEIRMMNMDDRDRPLTMAVEGVGDLLNKIWESIKKILGMIPKLCTKLIEKIKDSKLVASKNVNKAEDLPASASNLSADKLSKYKSYRAEIDSRRKKLMHLTRDVVQTALNNCDQLNDVIVPILNACDESNFFNLKKNAKYAASEQKLGSLCKDMETNSQALSKLRSQAESLQSYLTQFKNEIGDEKMFGEWVPNYSGDDNYESIINDLKSKADKYKSEVDKQNNRFESIFRKAADKITGHSSQGNDGYQLLQKYQNNCKQCNEILQAYTAVATVVYGVYTQGISGDTKNVDNGTITSGSSGWVWNNSNKSNAHWDYKAMVRLKSGKKITLTYAYNQEKNENQKPTRDIEQVKKDILNDYNTHRANGDPAEEVIGEGGAAETKSDIQNAAHKISATIIGTADKLDNAFKTADKAVIRGTLKKDEREMFDKLVEQNEKQGYKYKGYHNGVIAFVDPNKDHIKDDNMKAAKNYADEARKLGYSDQQISQLKNDVANGKVRDDSAWTAWKNSNTPQNKPTPTSNDDDNENSGNQNQQTNNSTSNNNTNNNQNAQNQQASNNQQQVNQSFKDNALKAAKNKGYDDNQIGVLTKMIDSGNISNSKQFKNWTNKNAPNKKKRKLFSRSAKDSALFMDEQYETALEYMYDYGMSWEDAVEAVYEDMDTEEQAYIDAAVESLFEDDFNYEPSNYEDADEDKWDNFLT